MDIFEVKKNLKEVGIMALIEYRKKKGSDQWHFCTNCPDYPQEDYDTWCGATRPPGGKICEECILLEESDEKDCNPNYCT